MGVEEGSRGWGGARHFLTLHFPTPWMEHKEFLPEVEGNRACIQLAAKYLQRCEMWEMGTTWPRGWGRSEASAAGNPLAAAAAESRWLPISFARAGPRGQEIHCLAQEGVTRALGSAASRSCY